MAVSEPSPALPLPLSALRKKGQLPIFFEGFRRRPAGGLISEPVFLRASASPLERLNRNRGGANGDSREKDRHEKEGRRCPVLFAFFRDSLARLSAGQELHTGELGGPAPGEGSLLRHAEAESVGYGRMLSVNQGGGVDEFDNQLNDPGQYDNPQDPASLSVVEHLRALSVKGKLTLLYVLAVILLLVLWLDWVSSLLP